jgi:hypothetical protein
LFDRFRRLAKPFRIEYNTILKRWIFSAEVKERAIRLIYAPARSVWRLDIRIVNGIMGRLVAIQGVKLWRREGDMMELNMMKKRMFAEDDCDELYVMVVNYPAA